MELWFTEKQTPSLGITLKSSRTLHTEKTEFQDLAVLETEQYGRMLVLDGMVQTTEKDEFVYHEMISHPALVTHPTPRRVAVVGGGDGGVIREILKYSSVETAVLIEIDGRVVDVSREYLPYISSGLDDVRCEIRVEDGIKHMADSEDEYDIVIVDSTEPVGAAIGLFSTPFYRSVFRALTDDGVLVAQTESPFINSDLIQRSFQSMSQVFPITRTYLASVPTYPSGLWSFTMGSKKHNPATATAPNWDLTTKYYHPQMQQAIFQLPRFVEDLLKK